MPRPRIVTQRLTVSPPWPAAQVRTAVDAWLTAKLPDLTAAQNAYFATHGRYWQGLLSHISAPAHTDSHDGEAAPDRMASKPTDQAESWSDVLPGWATVRFPGRLQVDVYDGPSGKGWVYIADVMHNGTRFRRIVNVGPETFRTQGWYQVIPMAGG